MTEYLLNRFPLPPSSNHLYASVNGRLVKSSEGRRYEQSCALWALKNHRILDAVKKAADLTRLPYAINLDMTFVFLHARIVGKKNQMKRLDVANRVKAAQDNFCKAAKFDDSLIIGGNIEKITCQDSRDEQVIFKLRLAQLKSFEDYKSSISSSLDS